MLKTLLALLVVLLAVVLWLLTDTLSLPGWAAPSALIAALVVVVGIVTLEILQRRRRRRDQQRQAERSPFFITIANLRSRCEHAVETLRNQGADALPWVLVLGPQGAGKTAAIRSSGVSFRDGLGPERFIAAGDVTPTENIQFLASEQVVFLDTAGRYLCDTPQHDDRREWLELLTILRNQRPAHPLAGVVLAVSATQLAGTSVDDPAQLGHGLRRRLDDLQRELATSVPVYLLVTRIDELAGMQRLIASDPGDRFGFSVELSGAGASKARRVAESPLAELALAIERRAFAQIERAATAEERGELYRAPAHFRRLVESTAALIGALFPDHGELDAPIWRGLYFASAGSTVPTPGADPELQQIARDYGDPPQTGAGLPPSLARPAFLHGLFGVELPADRWVAAWSRKRRSQQQFRHGLRVILLGAAAVGGLSLSLGAAEANHRLLGRVSTAIGALASAPGPATRILHPEHIAPLQQLHATLREHREQGAPWTLRFGLYQGSALVDDVERAYFSNARDRLLVPLVTHAGTHLKSVQAQHHDGNDPVPVEQFWRTVDALHLYLLLTRSNTGAVSLRDPAQQTWLATHMPLAWTRAAGLRTHELTEAQAVSRSYIAELTRRPDDLATRDAELVESARRILRRTPRGQMWADELATQQIPGTSAITLTTIAHSAPWLVSKENQRVEPAYTRRGWDHVRQQIQCSADPELRYITAALVIDERPCDDERKLLHGEYFKRYNKAWSSFIRDVYVEEPEGYKAIHTQIVDMVTPGGAGVNALANLFKVIGDNTELPESPDPFALLKPASGTPTTAVVPNAFKAFYTYGRPDAANPAASTALDAYITHLGNVATPLGLYNKEGKPEKLTQAQQAASLTYDLVHNEHLTQRGRVWSEPLTELLDPPIRGLLDAVDRGVLDELSRRWCNEVVHEFDGMRTCYPFTAAASCDVSRAEVTGLFQPQGGKLWLLYNDALNRKFPFEGDRYVAASQGDNSRYKPNPRVATFLTHAREFHEVLFPNNAPDPTFAFAVQFKPMPSASSISLVVNGTSVTYTNNDRERSQPLIWPGAGGDAGARVEAKIQSGTAKHSVPGDWGLFRLIEEVSVSRSGRLIVAKVDFTDRKDIAEIRINPEQGAGNPLFGKNRPAAKNDEKEPGLMGIFREQYLSPPRQLFHGGMTCPPLNPTPTP